MIGHATPTGHIGSSAYHGHEQRSNAYFASKERQQIVPSGWGRRFMIGAGVLGLVLAFASIIFGEEQPVKWQIAAQGLWLTAMTMFTVFGVRRDARLAGSVATAIAAGLMGWIIAADREPSAFVASIRVVMAVGFGAFAILGVISIWRPSVILGSAASPRRHLSAQAARRAVLILLVTVGVLIVLVAGLLAWIYAVRT